MTTERETTQQRFHRNITEAIAEHDAAQLAKYGTRCDHCKEAVTQDRNGFWVGEDSTSDCSVSAIGHEVDGSITA